MKNFLFIISILMFSACGSKQTEKEANTFKLSGDTIIIDEASIIAPKLKIEALLIK